ncbi:MAG: hypothetical protein C0190_01415 [Thermodesulfobacterium geofontis]|uniref:asparagine synthase (glutamine-hydrolyzing) n=1 Tax=Thermodesulfobacterium geofontis TaxID=1295609 RepID=A0A2N7PQ05_9BACT|nr:MAG: hypothetical protein C0190_01415 [Thermodesulfobacterium geofontis]
MVKITPKDCSLILEGDIGGERPCYVYIPPHKNYIIYSYSMEELLQLKEIKYNLEISEEGVSFFLQSGVIPPPKTIFKNIFVLNIGDKLYLKADNNKIKEEFHHEYPFFNSYRNPELIPDEDYLLSMLAETVRTRKIFGSPTYLFQSLGKDSNTILLALAEAGYQREIICLTLSTEDRKDESEIAEKIAQKLGFKHQKLPLPSKIEKKHIDELIYYFENIPFPCADGTSLVYPIYATQLDFKKTDIIDGSGNDIYFGHIPRPIEYKRQKIYPKFVFFRDWVENLSTGHILQKFSLTRCEMAIYILKGLSYGDCKKIFPESVPVYFYWMEEDKKRKNWDYIDLKGDIWGTKAEYDLVMKKVRNFVSVYKANPIFPWCNKDIALYIGRLPEKYLFDRGKFKNKLLLRKILKERLNLDSDLIGKYSYGFSAYQFLKPILNIVENEILNCKLWDKKGIKVFWKELKERSDKEKIYRKILVRLFLISAWYNHNFYLRKG